METDSLTASTQVFATLQRWTIEEWPFCEQNNTLLGFTALFTHHNYPPHFEEVGENISESETRKRNRILNFTPFRSVPFRKGRYTGHFARSLTHVARVNESVYMSARMLIVAKTCTPARSPKPWSTAVH